jgi:dTDP-4-amino-4,6-dideoxygalactose transaminase
MKISANRLDRGFDKYKEEYEKKAIEVLESGWYILGPEVENFEREFADYVGTDFCVGLGCGLDALYLAVRLLDIGQGDEVIVQGNAYIASVMGITMNGATPVFVEPNAYFNIDTEKIEESITAKTKAILVVHLYGQASNMEHVMQIAEKYNLKVIEDCAQSHGACYKGRMTGSWGDIGCFSFYPSKNMGAFGDAGALVTNNKSVQERAMALRNYGSKKRYYNDEIGINSRLDELQAGLLRVKLKHIQQINEERNNICQRYLSGIQNPSLELPRIANDATTVWHQFVIRVAEREKLIQYLDKNDIQTTIHYPIPPHLQKAYKNLDYGLESFPITKKYADEVLSLPLFNGMREEEIQKVINVLNDFE